VHAADLARALVAAARSPATLAGTYFAAHPEVVTLLEIVEAAEAAVGRRTRRLRLPESLMELVGRVADLGSQWTGRSSVLGGERMQELVAGDWVCDVTPLEAASGWRAQVPLRQGFLETAAWYREQGLMR
jgi:nucleoside-diphosphate-sugar epimerase